MTGGHPSAGPGRWQPFGSLWDYARPRESLRPPVWRERRRKAAEARLLAAHRPPPPPAGDRAPPVLVIPGFGAPDAGFGPLREWLAEGGWDVRATGAVPRKRCGSVEVVDLERRVRDVRARTGRRVLLLGHSRGGQLAKALAVREPDLVAGVIAFGSPLTDPFGTHLVVRALTTYLSWLTRAGIGEWVRECATGTCCQQFHDAVVGRLPDEVPLWSVVSPTDGIVLPAAGRDPQATVLELDSSHGGMPVNPRVWTALGRALADPRLRDR